MVLQESFRNQTGRNHVRNQDQFGSLFARVAGTEPQVVRTVVVHRVVEPGKLTGFAGREGTRVLDIACSMFRLGLPSAFPYFARVAMAATNSELPYQPMGRVR